jgi:hypothetical protein
LALLRGALAPGSYLGAEMHLGSELLINVFFSHLFPLGSGLDFVSPIVWSYCVCESTEIDFIFLLEVEDINKTTPCQGLNSSDKGPLRTLEHSNIKREEKSF